MLVLSRRTDDAIVFPKLGITIKILRLSRQVARIGIEAPDDVRVLRQELGDGTSEQMFSADAMDTRVQGSREDLHEIRNRLNTINLGLQFYRQQMDAGMVDEANVTFLRVLDELRKIEEKVDSQVGSAPPAIPAEGDVASIRLLLVEDDPNQRELLASVLSMRGCEVATASDGDDAIRYLNEHGMPDFVLMDMRMPKRDGASTIRQLRQAKANHAMRILAISGTSPEEFGIGTGPGGVDQWFPKPVNTDGLIRYMSQPTRAGLLPTA